VTFLAFAWAFRVDLVRVLPARLATRLRRGR
jgi:hypothetical protein